MLPVVENTDVSLVQSTTCEAHVAFHLGKLVQQIYYKIVGAMKCDFIVVKIFLFN